MPHQCSAAKYRIFRMVRFDPYQMRSHSTKKRLLVALKGLTMKVGRVQRVPVKAFGQEGARLLHEGVQVVR